jgi:hypothetical protein
MLLGDHSKLFQANLCSRMTLYLKDLFASWSIIVKFADLSACVVRNIDGGMWFLASKAYHLAGTLRWSSKSMASDNDLRRR